MKFSIFDVNPGSRTVTVAYSLPNGNKGLKAFQAVLKKNRLVADIRLDSEHVNLSYWKIVAAFYGVIPPEIVITNVRGRNADCAVIFKDSNPANCSIENLIINYNNSTYNLSEVMLGENLDEKVVDVNIEV